MEIHITQEHILQTIFPDKKFFLKKGSAAFSSLCIMFLIFLLCIPLSGLCNSFNFRLKKFQNENRQIKYLEEVSREFVNSVSDSGFTEGTWNFRGVTVNVESLNKKVNPVFLSSEVLSLFFDDEDSFKSFKQDFLMYERKDLSINLSNEYCDIFSPVPFFNLLLCPQETLSLFFELYDVSNALASERIENFIKSGKFPDSGSLKNILGSDYQKLYPCMSTAPLLDVNYIDEKILKKIIQKCVVGTKNANELTDKILSARSEEHIRTKQLNVFFPYKDFPLLRNLLGTETSFWELRFSAEKIILTERIFTGYPDENTLYCEKDISSGKNKIYIIQKRIKK